MSEWTKLSSLEELDRWLERSRREAVWIFKHSLTCSISSLALEEFRAFAAGAGAACALIEVQAARRLSDELASRVGVRHETPQVLLLRDEQALWHASHWNIRTDSLRRAVETPA
jgi:bacillithiol system protein YtxJ